MKLLGKQRLPFQPHPDPQLQVFWKLTQLAVLLLPLSSLLGSLGILIAALGVWRQRFQPIIRRPVNWGFAALSLLMMVSAVLAFKPGDAWLGLFNFLPFFLAFPALCELIQTPAQLRRLAWIGVISSIPVVILGLGQQFLGWAGEAELLWIVVKWTIDPTGNPPGRMASIFFYANVLASYLVISLILSLGLWIESLQPPVPTAAVDKATGSNPTLRSAKRLHARPWLRPASLCLGAAVLGNAIALILTDSRNAWAIAILAGLAFALYLGWRWLLAIVGSVAAAVLGAAFAPSPLRQGLRVVIPAFFWARLTDELYPNRPLAELRTTQWKFAWSLACQRPWTGWGLRNFSPIYQEQMHFFIGHPHNLWLMLMAETGFPAALLFYGLVGWVVWQGIQRLRCWLSLERHIDRDLSHDRLLLFTYLTAFLGCTLFSLLDITLFDVRINLLGWLLLAAIAGQVYHPLPEKQR